MRINFFSKRLNENIRSSVIYMAFVFMATMLIGACVGKNNMQASLKKESELSPITGDQTIECRRRAHTGSRLKKKICKTKAQWAREDQSKQKTAEKLQKDADRNRSLFVPVEDGMFPGTRPE